MIVELLLKKKVSVNARVKNVSKDSVLTALYIAFAWSSRHGKAVSKCLSSESFIKKLK
ncbi:hypothetical protein [Wolbachia pipientis]|uniref:hypothetical protein n=1 Tax=Wolbachia pipientis TaxID=955 RepID=UPI003364C431